MAIQGARPRKEEDAQKRIDGTAKWIEGKKLAYPVLLDPTAAYYESLDLVAGPYPVAFLLDAEGRIVWIGDTARRTFEKACEQALERMLETGNEKPAGPKAAPR